jgi:glycogen phosphorylase
MRPIRTFTVVPALPSALEPLREVAMNLRWAWDHDAIELFRRLDPDRWVASRRNPVRLLSLLDQEQLEAAAADEDVLAHLGRVRSSLAHYLDADDTWYRREHGDDDGRIAYFSAEFGVTDCLRIFAGGLGMLAGDHLKSASDLGLPLVGVGLLYQQGYFSQRLNEAGWQQEEPARNDFDQLPLALERDTDGEPLTVELGFPDGPVVAQIWRAQVGRVPLYLLDTNVPANAPEQRRITEQLYGGAEEMRMRQEVLLGIGGYRALRLVGEDPTVYHMNEGHSAFLALEHIRRLMEEHGVAFEEARAAAAPQLVFTTHTPVEAGHDYFSPDLLGRYFGVYAKSLDIEWDDFVGLGRQDPADQDERFCMTVLALRLSVRANGVSRLHGAVSRAMWRGLWPELPLHEVPIGHVTNGVHLGSWLAGETVELYDRVLGPDWREDPVRPDAWQRIAEVDDRELWEVHTVRRRKLVDFVRWRVRLQRERRGAPEHEVAAADDLLDPDALTIGFARRFATYKRAMLFARDPDRLAAIFGDPDRPVQLIVAGKAHPRDDAGKELIRQVVELSRDPRFEGRVVFVEDYGMSLARRLVAGCDVWLNNPVRPREASGTSGMKAAVNGLLNLSTLDGWWDEAWSDLGHGKAPFGWAIGRGDDHREGEWRDAYEARSLYDLLEHDVVPSFYERDEEGLPRSWIARMKAAIGDLTSAFNTHRMVAEYVASHYQPAAEATRRLHADDLDGARELAAWHRRVGRAWDAVWCAADGQTPGGEGEVRVGDQLAPRATVHLGDLAPTDVIVELYVGPIGPDGAIEDGEAVAMDHLRADGDVHVYEATSLRPGRSGRYGYTVRVRAAHPELPDRPIPGGICWAEPDPA